MIIPVTHLIMRNRLRLVRQARQISQAELARRTKVSPTTISVIERSLDYWPQPQVRRKLAAELGVSEGELFYATSAEAADVA